jgi:2-furoate---CoA ligase
VPTLYHDLLHHPLFARTDVSSVRKLGFAGAPMTDALLKELDAAFHPDLFVNHYGSSEIYTFTIEQNATAKPGAAGRAGINQLIRVVRLGAKSADEIAAVGEEGEIVALIAGDESFEGYWRRPDADAAALRGQGLVGAARRLFDQDLRRRRFGGAFVERSDRSVGLSDEPENHEHWTELVHHRAHREDPLSSGEPVNPE